MNINLKNLINVYGENASIADIPTSSIKYGPSHNYKIYYGNNLISKVYHGNNKLFDKSINPKTIISCQNNEILKINNIYITNIDGSNSSTITAYIDNETTILGFLAKQTTVNVGQTIDLIVGQTSSIYLTEGQSIKLVAGSSGDLSGFVSYEKIT